MVRMYPRNSDGADVALLPRRASLLADNFVVMLRIALRMAVETLDGSAKTAVAVFLYICRYIGLLKVLHSLGVDIEVNGQSVDLKMVLDENGTAFFVVPKSEIPSEHDCDREVDAIMSGSSAQGGTTDASHMLSDPERSPISSPGGSRPPSPSGAKSDSEAVVVSHANRQQSNGQGMYLSELERGASVSSSNLLQYVGTTIGTTTTSGSGRTAPIPTGADDDAESGRGRSVPQSPVQLIPLEALSPVQMSSGMIVAPEVRAPCASGVSVSIPAAMSLSLCGPLTNEDGVTVAAEHFQQYRMSWESFDRDPIRHLLNPDLFVAIGEHVDGTSLDRCLPWPVAAAQLIAMVAYGRQFSDERLIELTSRYLDEKRGKMQKTPSQYSSATWLSSWFSRSGAKKPGQIDPAAIEAPRSNAVHPLPTTDLAGSASSIGPTAIPAAPSPPPLHGSAPSPPPVAPATAGAPATSPGRQGARSRLLRDVCYETEEDDDDEVMSVSPPPSQLLRTAPLSAESSPEVSKFKKPPVRRHPRRNRLLSESSIRRYGRTRRLTSDQIKAMDLKPGQNDFTFSVTHQFTGTTKLNCRVFVWRYDSRLVVSDIDGTITRSDVLGQVLPIMGLEWTQPGVASLFSMLARNNYKIVYLSARSIGMADSTRQYLMSIPGLPPGPLMLSPTSLVNAFYKEVIERVPERFKVAGNATTPCIKISCLSGINELFPLNEEYGSAFYAGFGNRHTDSVAYRSLGIPPSRIYIVNPRSELRHDASSSFKSTYDMLAESVDLFFPPVGEYSSMSVESATSKIVKEWGQNSQSTGSFVAVNMEDIQPATATVNVPVRSSHAAHDFSSFAYWRPPPDV